MHHSSAQTSSDYAVSLSGIVKRFGDLTAVAGFNQDIPKGEFVTLLGPSGCGKTTTLRMVAGFLEPTAGEIYIGGRLMNSVPAYARNCGMVFQNYALFPHLTTFDNVAYGLKIRHVNKKERQQRVSQMLEMVQLSGREKHYPKQLSGGQQQRVALARALILEPNVLLLDEPLSNLDAKLRIQMREEIRTIVKSLGMTAIYVTHDQEEALTIADKIVVMDQGLVEQVGSPEDVYERPETVFVATFIGSTNLLEDVEVVGSAEGDVYHLKTQQGVQLYGKKANPNQASPAGKMALSIRPERVQIGRPEATEDADYGTYPNTFVGSITFKTYIGSTIRYRVALDGVEMVVDHQNRDIAQFSVGEQARVWWNPQDALLVAGRPDSSPSNDAEE